MKRYGGGSFRKPVCVRTCLKNRILVPDRGGAEFQTAGILLYVEDLKRGTNKDMGPKDIFEIGYHQFNWKGTEYGTQGL